MATAVSDGHTSRFLVKDATFHCCSGIVNPLLIGSIVFGFNSLLSLCWIATLGVKTASNHPESRRRRLLLTVFGYQYNAVQGNSFESISVALVCTVTTYDLFRLRDSSRETSGTRLLSLYERGVSMTNAVFASAESRDRESYLVVLLRLCKFNRYATLTKRIMNPAMSGIRSLSTIWSTNSCCRCAGARAGGGP